MTAIDLDITKLAADRLFQRKRLMGFSIPAVILAYLTYIFFAFDLPGLAERANMDNAVTLVSDSWLQQISARRATGGSPRSCNLGDPRGWRV